MIEQQAKSGIKKSKGKVKDRLRRLQEHRYISNSEILEKPLYFNSFELKKAFNYTRTNPYKAKEALEEYLDKYPLDISGLTYYASALVCISNYDEAEKVADKVEELMGVHNVFLFDEEKYKIVRHNLNLVRLKIYGYRHQNMEALKYYYDHYYDFAEMGGEIPFYFKGQVGMLDPNRRENKPYIMRQIVDYKEEDFRDHIKKHLADTNKNDKSVSTVFFHADFPVDKVIEEIKKYIPGEDHINLGFFENTYVFKYDECGRDTDRITNYFKVVTFTDTDHFITMCPSNGCEDLPCVDLNYLKEKSIEDEDVKVKSISGKERFNKRFNREDN